MLNRLVTAAAALLLSAPAALVPPVVSAGDSAPISLDDIEEAKAARLMKNREDIDVQSTYHEDDIRGTGDVSDENAARLVRNRGPITAKVTASGTHSRYPSYGAPVELSLVAWKFAGDEGLVRGLLEEKVGSGGEGGGGGSAIALKVDVDCMVRGEGHAIVGGSVTEADESHPAGEGRARRAYVKVVDGRGGGADAVSGLLLDDGIGSSCSTPQLDAGLTQLMEGDGGKVSNAVVSICSKRGGDWEECLAKAKAEQAIQ